MNSELEKKKKDILKKFKNGEERYKNDSLFQTTIDRMIYGDDPLKVMDTLLMAVDNSIKLVAGKRNNDNIGKDLFNLISRNKFDDGFSEVWGMSIPSRQLDGSGVLLKFVEKHGNSLAVSTHFVKGVYLHKESNFSKEFFVIKA